MEPTDESSERRGGDPPGEIRMHEGAPRAAAHERPQWLQMPGPPGRAHLVRAGGDELPAANASEFAEALDRLGVRREVAVRGASVGGLRALMRAARFKLALDSHAAQLRGHASSSGRAAGLRASGASAKNRASEAPDGVDEPPLAVSMEWRERLGLSEREGAGSLSEGAAEVSDGDPAAAATAEADAAAVAAADSCLIESLESQLVEVVMGCGEVVSLLLGELQAAHRLRRGAFEGRIQGKPAGAADATGNRGKPVASARAAARPPAMLANERSRLVRRSRANMCGQHDLLNQLIACRLDPL